MSSQTVRNNIFKDKATIVGRDININQGRKEPFRLNDFDRDLLVNVIENLYNIECTYISDQYAYSLRKNFEKIDIYKKNKINNISQKYFKDNIEGYVKYFGKLFDIFEQGDDLYSKIDLIIRTFRSKYHEDDSYSFIDYYLKIKDYTIDISYKKGLFSVQTFNKKLEIDTFFAYLYFICEIGETK